MLVSCRHHLVIVFCNREGRVERSLRLPRRGASLQCHILQVDFQLIVPVVVLLEVALLLLDAPAEIPGHTVHPDLSILIARIMHEFKDVSTLRKVVVLNQLGVIVDCLRIVFVVSLVNGDC